MLFNVFFISFLLSIYAILFYKKAVGIRERQPWDLEGLRKEYREVRRVRMMVYLWAACVCMCYAGMATDLFNILPSGISFSFLIEMMSKLIGYDEHNFLSNVLHLLYFRGEYKWGKYEVPRMSTLKMRTK